MAGSSSKKFQAPKGTRDFYPADLAVRRHIEGVWRQVSINHGFDEIDGPTFEHLDLYTHKSGPGIASELFQVFSGKDPEQVAAIRAGETAPLALRPEFTPTLARMVAAKAPELPRPIKWFAIPSHFRAESPQRGRLREFMQWNVDFVGDDSPRADAEVIATAVSAIESLGLSAVDVHVKVSDRRIINDILEKTGVAAVNVDAALALLDRREKLSQEHFAVEAEKLGLGSAFFEQVREIGSVYEELDVTRGSKRQLLQRFTGLESFLGFWDELESLGLTRWCVPDFTLARGLAYYTGTVFEIIAESERAIAGGGRYDKLIESFGGSPLPACGFGMGDVVLANILRDKGLLKPAENYLPRPDAFVIAASDDAAAKLASIVANLRRGGLHVRHSYKTTRNVGKLLGDAAKSRARYAVMLGEELAGSPPAAIVKDLIAGVQDPQPVPINELAMRLRRANADD